MTHLPGRRSTPVLWGCAGLALALAAMMLHVLFADGHDARLVATRAIVEALDLTDLALFSEARYTRHLSQADLATPFQDGPRSLEHFPAGSFTSPSRTFPPAGFTNGPVSD